MFLYFIAQYIYISLHLVELNCSLDKHTHGTIEHRLTKIVPRKVNSK